MTDLTHFLRLYGAWRNNQLRSFNPPDVQSRQLLSLVRQARDTSFGEDHGFSSIKSVEDYQRQVPLRYYENFWIDYWKPAFPRLANCTWPGTIPYFPVSSGTSSGTTKYIPYTQAAINSNKKAGLDLLVYHLNNRPKSRVFSGKSFILGGSTDLVEETPGIFSGDLSGIAVKTLPWWARLIYFPPPEIALLKNWEEKIDILARQSLVNNIRVLSGVPSWLLILFKKLAEVKPQSDGTIAGYYPNLEMLVHGGVNFAPYYKQFQELLRGSHAELREVYPASEGFIAIGDRGYGEGLRLNIDHGIFYEFVPLEELKNPNPTRHWIQDVELDVNYAIVLTTCAGLWSYVLGDTVKFVERYPHRLLVTGRTSYYLSAFGEHLIADEIEDAISTAAETTGTSVTDFSVTPLYPDEKNTLGGHLYLVEFAGKIPTDAQLADFTASLDKKLCQRNEDYAAHRAEGFGLRTPQIQILKSGCFAAWMKSRGKLGGQHKVPRIINDQQLFASLSSFAAKY